MPFTIEQQQAIEHSGRNLQLIACAGSGKTEVLARRVVHLLTPGHPSTLAPRNIVAFTFTEKAAAELKERILLRTREALGDLVGLSELFVGTIHGFCLDILRGETIHYSTYGVLNEVQQKLFINRYSTLCGLTTTTDLQGRELRRYTDTKRYAEALSILREASLEFAHLRDCSILTGFKKYLDLLSAKRYWDYSAILEDALELLSEHEQVRARVGARVKQVFVDEYQDVNPIQEKLVFSLADLGAALCVVGDDDQTIYQWRGSDVANILTFRSRYEDVTTIRLEANFRSSEGVVHTARSFIRENTNRLPKEMQSTTAQSYEEGDIVALDFDSPEREAEYLAKTAKSLRGMVIREGDTERGLAWSDIAVLLRSVKASGKPITDALTREKIPFVVIGMTDLFSTCEASACRNLFYFLASHEPVGATAVDEQMLLSQWAGLGIDVAPTDLERAIMQLRSVKQALHSVDAPRWASYSLQRTLLEFLEAARIREDSTSGAQAEIVFYNLGKVSQVISDFESINFHSEPIQKYEQFARFLEHDAEKSYGEGWQDSQHANPDAVRIMTVHQAKGMEWPAVFLPALVRNRFPAGSVGGATVWHVIPRDAVEGQPRYIGSLEDERRLFYVAMTRSKKYLHMTWAPTGGSRFRERSPFLSSVRNSGYVIGWQPDYSGRLRLSPEAKKTGTHMSISFSDLKYLLECPYQFKLRVLYGFNAPIHEAMGYGRSLHAVLNEIHTRAREGEGISGNQVHSMIDAHLHIPFGYEQLRNQLKEAGARIIEKYLDSHGDMLRESEVSEQPVVVNVGEGFSITGRIDLVRRSDTGECVVVDFKTSRRDEPEQLSDAQLQIYALGYQQMTGRAPDRVVVHDLDSDTQTVRPVDAAMLESARAKTQQAAALLREGNFRALPETSKCARCDVRGICGSRVGD